MSLTDDDLSRIAALIDAALESRGLRRRPNRLSDSEMKQRVEASKRAAQARHEKRSGHRAGVRKKSIKSDTSIRPGQSPVTGEKVVVQESGAPPSTQVFLRYATAFKLRYGTFPVRNAKINGMIGKLLQRVPRDEAPEIAAFYVSHDRSLYTASSHCIDLLLRDCEALRMEWATGRTTVTKVNGSHVTTVSKAWWETWSSIKAQGDELGIDEGDNPTEFKFEVLRAAYKAGRLPEEVAIKMGVGDGSREG